MAKKVIISESMMLEYVTRKMLQESNLSKDEINKAIKDALKNDRDVNSTIEKKVKKLVADAVNVLFRTLWQRRNFYEDEIKR